MMSKKSGLASLYNRNLNAYSIQMNKSESVDTIRLDSYINNKKIKHIHFLKIDIEGHELKALEGGGIHEWGLYRLFTTRIRWR